MWYHPDFLTTLLLTCLRFHHYLRPNSQTRQIQIQIRHQYLSKSQTLHRYEGPQLRQCLPKLLHLPFSATSYVWSSHHPIPRCERVLHLKVTHEVLRRGLSIQLQYSGLRVRCPTHRVPHLPLLMTSNSRKDLGQVLGSTQCRRCLVIWNPSKTRMILVP
jgi:hypothetical protein